MAWMPGVEAGQRGCSGCWFPLKVIELKGDLPGQADFGKTVALVAQFPGSKSEWPYLFQGNHPFTRWRKPTQEEVSKIHHFYSAVPV